MDIEELILLKENSQLLVMKSWRHDIPQEVRNIIIAESLNECTIHKDFNVLGYLITKRRLFLIGSSVTTPFQEILHYFYKQVAQKIFHYKKTAAFIHHNSCDIDYDTPHELFDKYPFYNEYIRKLITGKKIVSPFYNPYVERLKNYIHQHKYSSALDYAGGKGPVIVAVDEIIL